MRRTLTFLLFLTAAAVAASAAPRALLIDSVPGSPLTQAIKAVLEENGLFQVELLYAPPKVDPDFHPQFDKYKVVVLNYGEAAWPLTAMASLEKYLQNGGGIVVLPGADSAFPVWPEYNLMLGVSSAPNRGPKAGPIWFYKGGNVEYDSVTPGQAGKAPQPDQPFAVTIRDTEHPVTKGLPLVWMHAADRLHGNLRGPGRDMTVLATASSDPTRGGTGRDEIQILAVNYGKGRVFHTLLGNSLEAISCAGYQTLLQRGAEWAATGKVSRKIPADFPGADKVSVRSAGGDKASGGGKASKGAR